jgi:predicted amidohydrolase YtcJ
MSGAPAGPLREAHAHLVMHGRELAQLDLSSCAGLAECLERVRDEAARLDQADPPRSRWLLANGVRIESWPERRWPTKAEIERVVGSPRCAAIMSFDHHALVASSSALLAAGLHEDSSNPPGGVIERDARGRMTGLVLESACWKVRQAVPELLPSERLDVLRMALADLARHGFSEVHDLLSPPWLGPALGELERSGELTQDIWLYPAIEELEAQHRSRASWESAPRGGRLRLAGGKVFIDGTLNSRTAWMLEPYADGLPALPKGQPMLTLAKIREALALTQELGVGLAAHAIGDAAVRTVLDVGQKQAPRHGGTEARSERDVPWLRIEHAELVDLADVPRFAELGVVCSVQPCHLLYDIEALERGCPGRLDRVLPLRELIEAGCRPGELMWFGSDTPIVRPDPIDSVIAATKRGRVAGSPWGPPSRAIGIGQALSEAEAWGAFSPASRRSK